MVSSDPWDRVYDLQDLIEALKSASDQATELGLIDAANSIDYGIEDTQEALDEALEAANEWQTAENAELGAVAGWGVM